MFFDYNSRYKKGLHTYDNEVTLTGIEQCIIQKYNVSGWYSSRYEKINT